MSDALPLEAPDESTAAAPAPVEDTAAEQGSAGDGEAVVPAARFNGLMSKYNAEKAEYEARMAAMEAELNSLRELEKDEPVADSDLTGEVAALREMLIAERLDNARQKALTEFPDAKPFADLIVGNSPEEILSVAEAIHERAQSLKTATTPPASQEAPDVETPPVDQGAPEVEPPVIGGGVPANGGATTVAEKRREAIERGDFAGFMEAAFEAQVLSERGAA